MGRSRLDGGEGFETGKSAMGVAESSGEAGNVSIDVGMKEDPRLATFKREWFEGKDCLDIGCNEGLITINIAKKFFCRSILGIDIGAGLIETAYWNLWKIAKMEISKSQESLPTDDVFKRISFLRENFVESSRGCSEMYDTTVCLSVTKWIHLNWGDDGLINMFVKIWRLLRPKQDNFSFPIVAMACCMFPIFWAKKRNQRLQVLSALECTF
ncbi:putative RNA methyltransferase [Canna indica]|uniref:RNA methyltransferase n=1 Tax=Canna indica TaxID=4628 RepID=A0AAQ3KF13_9LILI|nr:putative RNA methyltransferase [Canna indica]